MDELELNPPMMEATAPVGGFWREVWRRFRRRKLAMISLIFVVFLCLVAIFAPMIVGTKRVANPTDPASVMKLVDQELGS